jgi:hypothetical protein
MYDITKTRMLLTTAVFAAVASLFACGANAMLLADGGSGGGAQPFTSGHQLDTAIGTAMATRAAETAGQFTSGHQLDTAIGTAMATRAAETAQPAAEPWGGQVSLGLTGDSALKVDRAVAAANEAYDTYRDKTAIAAREALFTDQQPSVGLTGDSALTRVNQPVGATGQATSSGNDTDWTWVGFGAGMAALLAAALTGLYFSARHRGRVVLP